MYIFWIFPCLGGSSFKLLIFKVCVSPILEKASGQYPEFSLILPVITRTDTIFD